MTRSLYRVLSHLRSRPFLGPAVALTLLAGLVYRRMISWDPSAAGLPDVGWFFFSMNDTAPQVVFAVSALLLYRRRKRLSHALGEPASAGLALPFLAAGIALFLWAHHVEAPDLLVFSFPAFCLGSALLLFGTRFAGEMAFPVLFLVFAIPMPGVLTNHIVFPLQVWNAIHAAWLLNGIGIPVLQEGDTLFLTNQSFEIIETCSGFRSIHVLVMLAMALVCYFPARRLHVAILVASAFVIAYCVNTVRILTLVLNPHSELSTAHALQGVLLFISGSAALYAVDVALRRLLGDRSGSEEAPESADAAPGISPSGRFWQTLALTAVLCSMLAASIWMPRWSPPNSREVAPIELPDRIGDWEAIETLTPERPYLGTVYFNEHRYRLYRRGSETVSVFVGYEDRLSRSRSLVSPKNAFPGRGWEVEKRSLIALLPDGSNAVVVAARSQTRRMLSYHWYQGIEGLGEEVLRTWLGTDRSCLRRPTGALVIRLTTGVAPTREGRSRAEARLQELAPPVLEMFSDFGAQVGGG